MDFLACSFYLLMFRESLLPVAITSSCQHQTELLAREKETAHVVLQQNSKINCDVDASQSEMFLRSTLGKRILPLSSVVKNEHLVPCCKTQIVFEMETLANFIADII